MWELQQTSGDGKGAWSWQQFNLKPWEAGDSPFYGAVLAAVAVRTAPENYPATPEIQNNLKMLREYLVRGYPKQSSINRVELLWVSTKWPGLLSPEQQKSIIDEVLATFRRKNEARSGQFVEDYQAISSPNVTFPLTFPIVCLTCVHE